MPKNVKECPFCGEISLVGKLGTYSLSFKDGSTVKELKVDNAKWEECQSCKERILSNKLSTQLEEERYKVMGLLNPKQLKRIRANLELTQQQTATLLRVGKKSYCRWENGTSIQSKSIDTFIRLVAQNADNIEFLNKLREKQFTTDEQDYDMLSTTLNSIKERAISYLREIHQEKNPPTKVCRVAASSKDVLSEEELEKIGKTLKNKVKQIK